MRGVFPKDHANAVSPALIDGQQGPIDLRRKIAQDLVGGGVDAQGGGYEEQERVDGREFAAREVAELLKLAALVVKPDARPIIQTL